MRGNTRGLDARRIRVPFTYLCELGNDLYKIGVSSNPQSTWCSKSVFVRCKDALHDQIPEVQNQHWRRLEKSVLDALCSHRFPTGRGGLGRVRQCEQYIRRQCQR